MTYHNHLVDVNERDSQGRCRFFSYYVTDESIADLLATAARIRRFIEWTRTVESVGVVWDRETGTVSATVVVDDRSFVLRTNLADAPDF